MIRGWESTHVWRNDDNPVLTLASALYEQAEKIRFHEVNETIFAKASYSLIPEAGGFIDL